MSKPSIWWFASGEHKKLSPSANSTHSSTEWEQDIKTTPNKTSTRLYGTKTKWKNSPLAITNNSTIFAHIILSYFSTPCPLSTRLGAFSFPETFSRKFFPKFFPILPRRLFSVFLVRKIMVSWGELFSTFLVRKIMGVEGTWRFPNGGGCPFLYALHITNRLYITNRPSRTPASLRSPQPLHRSGFSAKQVKNRSKVNIYLLDFV